VITHKPALNREDLESLEGSRLETHLKAAGWVETDRAPEFSVWKVEKDGQLFEILVPLDQSVDDYVERMDDALQTLVVVEHRTAREVFSTLKASMVDRFRARLVTVDDKTVLPLAAGALAIQGVRDLVLSAALVEDQGTQPFFATPNRARVMHLLRDHELAQTTEGSFVINVVARFPRTLFRVAPERRLLARLAKALAGVRDASNEATDSAYLSQVESGVSANLCAALGRTSVSERIKAVEFGWDWASEFESDKLPQSISFSHDTITHVREAGKLLRDVKPLSYVVLGRVKTLHHQQENSGYVTVEEPAGKVARVRLYLQGEEHQIAIRAYTSQELVTCSGQLIKRGREGSLMGVKGFKIVPQNG